MLGKAIVLIGGIAVFVTVGLFHTPSAVTVILLWAWIAIYRIQRWRSRAHEARAQREGKVWHEQPDLLWLIGSLLIVLMGFLQFGIEGLKLNRPIVGNIFDTTSIVLVLLGLPALCFLGRAYLLERNQQKGMDREVSLRQTARTGPQPKEAREE